MKNNILIIAAHPDDEVLGCGGTIARLSSEGQEVNVLILGEGITARDRRRNSAKRKKEIWTLHKQTDKANLLLGVKKVINLGLPDNRFDELPLIEIVKKIEEVKNKINPKVIFTHYRNDLNIDHRTTYRAVITATRPIKGELVQEIYSFETISSTEWNFPQTFSPNVFFDISKFIDIKIKAMEQYLSEIKKNIHPRSSRGIKLEAESHGIKTGFDFVEAFEAVRIMK